MEAFDGKEAFDLKEEGSDGGEIASLSTFITKHIPSISSGIPG